MFDAEMLDGVSSVEPFANRAFIVRTIRFFTLSLLPNICSDTTNALIPLW